VTFRRPRLRNSRSVLLLSLFLFVLPVCWAQSKKISATEAKGYVGQSATVCGHVASARYSERSKGQPTFLNLDEPYPKEIFTILIWGDSRSKFGTPETKFRDANVCVSGQITSYRGMPEIVVSDSSQLTLQNK
jgi:hypothetical protein